MSGKRREMCRNGGGDEKEKCRVYREKAVDMVVVEVSENGGGRS